MARTFFLQECPLHSQQGEVKLLTDTNTLIVVRSGSGFPDVMQSTQFLYEVGFKVWTSGGSHIGKSHVTIAAEKWSIHTRMYL